MRAALSRNAVVASALLNAAGDGAFLDVTWGGRQVDYTCRQEEIAFRWKKGRFMPL